MELKVVANEKEVIKPNYKKSSDALPQAKISNGK